MIQLNYFKDSNIRCHWQLCICQESMRGKYKTILEAERLFNDFQESGVLIKKYKSAKYGYRLTVVRLNNLIATFLCVKNEFGTQNGQIYLSDTTDEDMINLAKCFIHNTKLLKGKMLGKKIESDA